MCCALVSIAARLDMACWTWDVLVQVYMAKHQLRHLPCAKNNRNNRAG